MLLGCCASADDEAVGRLGCLRTGITQHRQVWFEVEHEHGVRDKGLVPVAVWEAHGGRPVFQWAWVVPEVGRALEALVTWYSARYYVSLL